MNKKHILLTSMQIERFLSENVNNQNNALRLSVLNKHRHVLRNYFIKAFKFIESS